jgi:transcriptional regulator with PAS, ATPase and Fis domain
VPARFSSGLAGCFISSRWKATRKAMRQSEAAQRLERLKAIASAIVEETLLLRYEVAFAEAATPSETIDLRSGLSFYEEVRRFEIRLIRMALNVTGNNQARAARLLGLGATTLHSKIKAYKAADNQ